MKKTILLSIPFLFAFQCEPETITPEPNCQCFNEIVFITQNDTLLIDRIPADDSKCELWGLGLEYQWMQNSNNVSRYIEICQ